MSEIVGEVSKQPERPKPGTLANVKARIHRSMEVNADNLKTLATTHPGSSGEKERADVLIQRGLWQIGMIESLVTQEINGRINDTSNPTDVDYVQLEKEAEGMPVTKAVELLDTWITQHETDPKSRAEEGHETFMEYARDLLLKLTEETGNVPQ